MRVDAPKSHRQAMQTGSACKLIFFSLDLMHGFFAIALSVSLLTGNLFASEQTTDDCMAPDFKHEVVLEGGDEEGAYSLSIRDVEAGEPLFTRAAGGYADFKLATLPANFKCLWSPDSKFVAIFERGTKRSGDTTIYYIHRHKAQEITISHLMSLLDPHLKARIRAMWVRPEVWLPDHVLILSVEGTQEGEEQMGFRFMLTLQLRVNKAGKAAVTVVSLKQDRSTDFSAK